MKSQDELLRSTPEAQGISSSAILAFVNAADEGRHGIHSFMLLRHGEAVAEGWWSPYAREIPHMLFSLSKSFTSTAVGLAVAEGRLTVDDRVLSYFPEQAPAEAGEHLAAMRLRHLLSMSTGHAQDAMVHTGEHPGADWASVILAEPVEFEPGTHFVYNNAASYLLSAIVQRATGMKVVDYLQPRLFEPLGIERPTWEVSPQGINTGGWGLSLKTEDIARFGQMYLQKGTWQGRRILPQAWVEEATSYQVSNGNSPDSDWAQGYGYQFWRCRHGAYRGDGAFGQYCLVMPDQDAVLAITSGVADMQAVLNLVWEHLLPAMSAGPLPEDPESSGPAAGQAVRPGAAAAGRQRGIPPAERVSGKTYVFDKNEQHIESLCLDFDHKGCVLTLRNDHGEQRIACGNGKWLQGTAAVMTPEPQRVAAAGAWTEDDTYVVKLYLIETPFCQTITCHFDDDRLTVDNRMNVSFGPLEQPRLIGHRA